MRSAPYTSKYRAYDVATFVLTHSLPGRYQPALNGYAQFPQIQQTLRLHPPPRLLNSILPLRRRATPTHGWLPPSLHPPPPPSPHISPRKLHNSRFQHLLCPLSHTLPIPTPPPHPVHPTTTHKATGMGTGMGTGTGTAMGTHLQAAGSRCSTHAPRRRSPRLQPVRAQRSHTT